MEAKTKMAGRYLGSTARVRSGGMKYQAATPAEMSEAAMPLPRPPSQELMNTAG